MKFLHWKIQLGLGLILLSVVLYALNYLIFRDLNYMGRLFLAQLGFLPVSVLLVTIIINQLLSQRAKAAKLRKLNMVIGAFFSEVGSDLLKIFSAYDCKLGDFRGEIKGLATWSDHNFAYFQQRLKNFDFKMVIREGKLEELRDFLVVKRDFLLRLLENPNLLEHDSFANLLLAVFHLTEELAQRRDLSRLTPGDREHLPGDIERAYVSLISEWLAYMRHLQKNYPYLFSLAWRTNPFDPEATPEIK
jgi:vacuolar-type H+-ATPase subunit I/STV1